MTYHKITKKLEKLERKNPEYKFIGINSKNVITTEKGREIFKENIAKLPKIYKEVKNAVDYNPLAKEILKIIGE